MHRFEAELIDALSLVDGLPRLPAEALEGARKRLPTLSEAPIGELKAIITGWVRISMFLQQKGSSADAQALLEIAEAAARIGNAALFEDTARDRLRPSSPRPMAPPPPADPVLAAELSALRRKNQVIRR